MKVISFSLWGKSQMYNLGAIVNADMAEKHWPDWICRYYVDESTPKPIIEELNDRDNTQVIQMNANVGFHGTFWRFFAASDPSVDVMLSRDTDSRIDGRDKAAVDDWLTSDKKFHIIRDHCQHGWLICAGTWGVRGDLLRDMKDLVEEYLKNDHNNNHGIDQRFLATMIYNRIAPHSLSHDEEFTFVNGQSPLEKKQKHPIPREKGNGWWSRDLPDWHSGLEDNPDNYDWGEQGHCHLFCPACGSFHDNDYIGKSKNKINKSDIEKYSYLLDCLD